MRRHLLLVAAVLAALAPLGPAPGAGVGHAATSSGQAGGNSRHAARRARHGQKAPLQSVEIRTIPIGRHLRFQLAGRIYTTNRNGRVLVPAADALAISHDLRTNPLLLRLLPNRRPDGSYYQLERWYARTTSRTAVYAALDLYRPVRLLLASRTGEPISTALVDSFQMKRIDGAVINLTGSQLQGPVVLQASRVVPLSTALVSKKLLYRVMRVSIGGNNLVHRAQQFFRPSDTVTVRLRLLFYLTRFKARDALFGFSIGSGIRLMYPNGRVQVDKFHNGVAFATLPRGTYHVKVIGPGLSPSSPVSVTRDHVAELEVFSYLDVAVVGVLFLALLLGLALVRRPALRRRLSPRLRLRLGRAARRAT